MPGAGVWRNKRLFQTSRYVGIDVDKDRLAAAQLRHPDAKVINAPIEDVGDLKGDMVLCVQVMHNRFFRVENTLAVVNALVQMVRPNGALIFNFGRPSFPYERQVDGLLAAAFTWVKKRKYGALSANQTVLAPLLAVAMFLIPCCAGTGFSQDVCRDRVFTRRIMCAGAGSRHDLGRDSGMVAASSENELGLRSWAKLIS